MPSYIDTLASESHNRSSICPLLAASTQEALPLEDVRDDVRRSIDLDFSMISQEQKQCLTRIALLAELGFHVDLCDKRSSVIVVRLLQPADFSIRCHFSCNISNCSGSWTENEKRTLLTTARFVDQISIFSVAFLLEAIGQIQQEAVFWM